jgi:hypothetical protein
VTVTGSASSQTASVTLAIFFADYLLSATPLLNTVTAGNSVTYTATVTPKYGFNYAVLLSCSNTTFLPLPQDTTCSWSPPAGTLDGKDPFNFTLTVTTTAQSGAMRRRGPPAGKPRAGPRWEFTLGGLGLALLALLTASLLARRTRGTMSAWLPLRLRLAGLVFILASLALGVECNQYVYGPNIGTAPITGTPTGEYTITLIGTLGSNSSVTRTTTVNLSVGP